MTAAAAPAPLPRPVPPLLSFVAGYVDSITFLALFGFFAAQVTGSFVVAAATIRFARATGDATSSKEGAEPTPPSQTAQTAS